MNTKLLLENKMSEQGLLLYTKLWRESLTDALRSCTGPNLNLKGTGGSSFAANIPRF